MQSVTQIRELLEMAGHGPKKALGQNFLIDQNLIHKLLDASGVQDGDLVLEIGPGTGALTVGLLERGCRVIASELDRDLARVVRETLGAQYSSQLEIIEGDCLAGKKSLNPEVVQALGDQPFSMVANLPYHAATPVMMTLMTRHERCSGMFVTIQREVVDRFLGASGSKAYGTISVVAQCLGDVEMIAKLKPGCFWPTPGVDSAMMGWRRRSEELCGSNVGLKVGPASDWWVELSDLSQLLFQSRRKKLGGVVKRIAGGEIQWPNGVSGDDRVDGLNPATVQRVCRAMSDTLHNR
ncbi:MAG: 16S rRNA (adenine(1518)-N(6)/adenine(1519)-N(6))-dimethyltransferase RsmA [Phycisphaerales bacterium]